MTTGIITGSLRDIVSYCIEIAILLWFFAPMKERKDTGGSMFGKVVRNLPLLLILVIYMTPLNASVSAFSIQNLWIQLFRMMMHLLPIGIWLYLTKNCDWKVAAYLASLVTAIYLTAQNLRMILMTYIAVTPLHSTSGRGYIIGLILTAAAELALAVLTRWLIKPEIISNIDKQRTLIMTIVLMIMVYFKWILTAIRELSIGGNRTMMVSFSIVTTIGLYVVLILFDYTRLLLIEKDRAEHEKTILQYEVRSAKREMQANSDIRRLYHDVKNHLLAIQSMAGDQTEIKEYLSELLPKFEGYETQVKTGNQAVDAILSEKIQRAYPDGIRFNVCLDLSGLAHIKTVDIVTIFGNAVDNAIEALRKTSGEDKFIFIKSSSFANNVVIRFQNKFDGKVELRNGEPVTSKKDAEMHGIGISSIRITAARYGGTVSIKADNDTKQFTLVVMLPLQN